jgi:hypothetical protein
MIAALRHHATSSSMSSPQCTHTPAKGGLRAGTIFLSLAYESDAYGCHACGHSRGHRRRQITHVRGPQTAGMTAEHRDVAAPR